VPRNAGESGIGSAMEPSALRTMAVTKILYIAIDLVPNAPAFATSVNHLSTPLIMSFLVYQAAHRAIR
jgi:hypothetical protein